MRMIFYYPLCYLNSSVFVRIECLPTKIFLQSAILWVFCSLARYNVPIRHTSGILYWSKFIYSNSVLAKTNLLDICMNLCVLALYLFSVPSNPSSMLFILKHVIKVTEQNHHNSFTLSTFIYLFVVRSFLIHLVLFL